MNTPRMNPDDPKWTAYVLGECDEHERAEIEQLLETSDEARALVEELRVATATLKDELMAPSIGLLADQRAAIRQAAGPAVAPVRPRRFASFPVRGAWGIGLAAASVVLLVGGLPLLMERGENATAVQMVARNEQQSSPAPVMDNSTERAGTPSQTTAEQQKLEDVVGAERYDEIRQAATDGVAPGQPLEQDVADLERLVARSPQVGQLNSAPKSAEAVVTIDQFSRRAQNAGGQLSGRVYDPTGALIPGVTVTARDANSGSFASVVSDATGAYSFSNLPAGEYNVSASLPGFTTSTLTNLQLADTANARHNFTMQIAQLASTVEVSVARAEPMFQTSSSTVGTGTGQAGRGGGALAGVAASAPIQVARAQDLPAAAPPPAPPAGINGIRFYDRIQPPSIGTESYDRILDNPFIRASQEPLATFSIDVDTASYANVRRFLNQNQLPPRDAVRIEELINYFSYDYAQPRGSAPIAPNMEVASAPWNPQNRLVRIGIKAREINADRRPPSNLVFLVDVSGSMNEPNKLPLVKSGLKMLVNNLSENDFVSMVVYAGASGLILPPTSGVRKDVINRAIDNLQAGGSTNGGAGLQLAYNQAVANFIRNGVNRVILMTDGDFNVGITNQGDLTRLIQDRAKSGVFLSVLGFGMGNLKDSTMEKLADMGNGHYAYIDTINEARKVLVEEMGSTLVTVAKDVKIQVDFNPGRVEAYRLIGYENRVLRAEDFNNDLKDAGDMGAGHTVTALFEVVPRGGSVPGPSIDPSRYQTPPVTETQRPAVSSSNEMLTLRVRYKLPDASDSTRMDVPLVDRGMDFSRASEDFRFAASVASFGMILRDSPYRGNWTLNTVLDTATSSRGQDRSGYRAEFISLVRRANTLR